jgi:hypothetical protein
MGFTAGLKNDNEPDGCKSKQFDEVVSGFENKTRSPNGIEFLSAPVLGWPGF